MFSINCHLEIRYQAILRFQKKSVLPITCQKPIFRVLLSPKSFCLNLFYYACYPFTLNGFLALLR
jgi:hypothetical protein